MKTFFLLTIALSTTLLNAETIKSRIHSIEDGLVKFENGRVAYLDSGEVNLAPNDVISAELDESSSLVSFEKISESNRSYFKNMNAFMQETEPPVFEPTVVPSMREAVNIFNRSNPNYKRISECSDRAHIWAHDEFKLTGTKSRKAFVFFTASYINSVRFKWWFHVAPLYRVNDNGTMKEMVMDFRFTDRPMSVKEWTDQFVYTKRTCKVTTKFSEYDVNPQTENCYLIYESMHYKLPVDIYNQELHNRYKTTTTESELTTAFNAAFLK